MNKPAIAECYSQLFAPGQTFGICCIVIRFNDLTHLHHTWPKNAASRLFNF